jgi:hypothetical protein
VNKKTGLLEEITEKEAVAKISQAIRDIRKSVKQLLRGKNEEYAMPCTPEEYIAYSVNFLHTLIEAEKSTYNKVLVPSLPPAKKNIAVRNASDQSPMANQSNKRNDKSMHLGKYMIEPSDSRSQCSGMSMSVSTFSTITGIRSVSSGQGSRSSVPKDDSQVSFKTSITAQSYQQVKYCDELDSIDKVITEMPIPYLSPTSSKGSVPEATLVSFETLSSAQSHQKAKHCNELDSINERISEMSMVSITSRSTISSKGSDPKGSRVAFDNLITFPSRHEEKHCCELDSIDEAITEMSFSSRPGRGDTKESFCSNVGDYWVESTTELPYFIRMNVSA